MIVFSSKECSLKKQFDGLKIFKSLVGDEFNKILEPLRVLRRRALAE